MDIEKIRELANNQYHKFNESNKKLIDMLLSEKVEEKWEDNYHLIDHDWIVKWKDNIYFDELETYNSNGDENSINKSIKEKVKSINYIEDFNNIGIYCLKENNNYLDPMKTFDIISDEFWRLFDIKNKNVIYNGKVSLLKGNRKILIRLNENIYFIKYLTNLDLILFGEFVIIFNSGENEEKKRIIEDIAKSNIYDWMKKIDFNSNERKFKINKYKIPFDIQQKTNNYTNKDNYFDREKNYSKEADKYVSFSKSSYSSHYSFLSSSSNSSILYSDQFISYFSEIKNYRIIQKYDQTTNVCSIMRSLSFITPFADYFTSRNKEFYIFSKYQSKCLLNLIRDFFMNLFDKVKDPYAPEDFTIYVKEKAEINIKEEQDPFNFLNSFMKYVNKRLNKIDSDIVYHFNDILYNKKEKLNNDIKKIEEIFDKNNSIIGKYFLGIILEIYKCDKCNKIIEEMKPFNILDLYYKGIINELQNKNNSIVGFNIDNLLEFYFLIKKIENMEKPTLSCKECGNKLAIIGRKIINYPEYLIIRLNRGKFNEKDGFEEKQSLSINYEKIVNLGNYSSEKIINENINSKEYNLINMVNSYKDKNVRFLSICQIKNIPAKKKVIWAKFKCNETPEKIKEDFKEDEETEPYILFYKLEIKQV